MAAGQQRPLNPAAAKMVHWRRRDAFYWGPLEPLQTRQTQDLKHLLSAAERVLSLRRVGFPRGGRKEPNTTTENYGLLTTLAINYNRSRLLLHVWFVLIIAI